MNDVAYRWVHLTCGRVHHLGELEGSIAPQVVTAFASQTVACGVGDRLGRSVAVTEVDVGRVNNRVNVVSQQVPGVDLHQRRTINQFIPLTDFLIYFVG